MGYIPDKSDEIRVGLLTEFVGVGRSAEGEGWSLLDERGGSESDLSGAFSYICLGVIQNCQHYKEPTLFVNPISP